MWSENNTAPRELQASQIWRPIADHVEVQIDDASAEQDDEAGEERPAHEREVLLRDEAIFFVSFILKPSVALVRLQGNGFSV